MKKIGLAVTVLFLSVGMVFFVSCKREQREQIRLATGGSAGTYYAYGSVLANTLAEKTNIPITVQSTGASKANIQLINSGEVEMAIVQNDVMDYAWRGVDLFNGEQVRTFRSMAGLYAETCQIIANPAAGIKTIADLTGKNVSVGDAGSGVEFNARQILEIYGITFSDIVKQNLSFAASADALRDNKIDAFFCTAGAPTPAVVDLATGKDIILLEIDEAHAREIIGSYPFYTRFPIPAGSYKGQTSDVMTVAIKAAFIVSSKLTENTVYQLTKSLFENKSEIEAAHVKGKELSPSYAVEGISVLLHPGAEKYFKEAGVLK
jgi:TRAP transporter TAXI family solute receptor